MTKRLAVDIAVALAMSVLPVATQAGEPAATDGVEPAQPQETSSGDTGQAVVPPQPEDVESADAAPPPALIEVDPAKLTMPGLAFAPTPEIEADYDKFFYFHRADTSFEQAYADIKECDALASGISFYLNSSAAMSGAMAQYGVAGGAIGGAIGSAIADAIFGSAQRREMRRVNLRNCMNFKEYKRYGLSRELWTEFNFEEGMGRKREAVREEALQLQALVASGPAPQTGELGL